MSWNFEHVSLATRRHYQTPLFAGFGPVALLYRWKARGEVRRKLRSCDWLKMREISDSSMLKKMQLSCMGSLKKPIHKCKAIHKQIPCNPQTNTMQSTNKYESYFFLLCVHWNVFGNPSVCTFKSNIFGNCFCAHL